MSGIKDLMTPQKICQDESLFDFVSRRLGNDVAKYAIDPMIRGICAGDSRKISAKAFVAGPLFELEQEYGSIFGGMMKRKVKGKSPKTEESKSEIVQKARKEKWSVWGLEGGLVTLIEELQHKLLDLGVDIIFNQGADQIRQEVNKQGAISGSDFTFWTTPAFSTSEAMTFDHDLSQILNTIPFVDVALMNYIFENDQEPLVQNPGFGFLVPSSEKDIPILGVIFDTCTFSQGNHSIFTVMMGGAWFNQLFGSNPSLSELDAIGLKHLKSIMKIKQDPVSKVIKLHRNCIAQYTIGHSQRVQKARDMILQKKYPISLIGSSYDGVGINDAIMSSKVQIEKFVKMNKF